MAEVNFSLERDYHLNCLVSKLHSMFEQGRFVDFTLAAADGQFIKVHRAILYTFSQYFEDLLDKRPENYDLVMLKDVSFDDLTALVEYMYKGTVTVSQQQVPSILKAASHLQIAGLTIHQSNLEVGTNNSDDIGFIQARPEEKEPTIQLEKDPEDVISNEMPTVAAESSAEMTEEEEGEENIFFVEELPRKLKVFRDGSLLVYEATPFSSRLDQNALGFISPMDEVEEGNCKDNSGNAERIAIKDKKGEDESNNQFSSEKNKNNISSEEFPNTSSVTQPNMKKNDALFPSKTVLETVNGISLRIPEQLGEVWMDTSDDDKENDVSSTATKLSLIQNIECNAHASDADILEDASSSTLQNKKGMKPARSLNQAKTKGNFRSSLAKRDPAVNQFKCSDCDCVYSLKSSLDRHLKYACGKTPALPCTQCNYRARTKWQLEKHLKLVHKTASEVQSTFPFKCGKCNRIFKLQRNLEKHLKKVCEMVGTSTK